MNTRTTTLLTLTLVTGSALLLSLSGSFSTEPGQAQAKSAPAQDALSQGKIELQKKNATQAIKLLEKAVQDHPDSCEGHLCLGKAYCQEKRYKDARSALTKAIRLGKGNENARQANKVMMDTIPHIELKPITGDGTEEIAMAVGLEGRSRSIGIAPKAKVVEFYADWCEPCQLLKPVLQKARAEYGKKIEFISYNVDDENNQAMLDKYEVSPIPTIIYLSPDNKVVGYSIGFAGERLIEKELQKIL